MITEIALASSLFCSFGPFGSFTHPKATRYIATATRDSIASQLKLPNWSTLNGESTDSIRSSPYSQIFHVDKISSAASPSLRDAIRKAGNRVVIVPWGYGPDCARATWPRSALWLKPGIRGLFAHIPRPQKEWLNGIPTFDGLFDIDEPYPSALVYRRDAAKNNAMSPDELLSYYDALPSVNYKQPKAKRVVEEERQGTAIRTWARRNPELSQKWPVKDWVIAWETDVGMPHFDTIASPLRGTYRLKVHVNGQSAMTLYARTPRLPTTVNNSDRPSEVSGPRRGPIMYYLYLSVQNDSSRLTTKWPAGNSSGYLTLSLQPISDTPDSTTWRAGFEIFGAITSYTEDSAAKNSLTEMGKTLFPANRRDDISYVPGKAVRYRNGSVTMHVPITRGNEVIGEILAERISDVTFDVPEG